MASAQNKGVVKAVISCDTIIVMGVPQGGPPPEKQITLAGIQGPRLGRRDGSTKDEPFAWAAREFVRAACVGKPCTFEIEEGTQSRTFGHINVGGENMASKIVSAGWAKVKPMGNANASKGAYVEELLQMEQKAMEAEIGMHTKEPKAVSGAVRNIIVPGDGGYDAKDLVALFKGQRVSMVIEQFRDGATVRGFLLPSMHWVTVFLSGVSCPGFKKAEGNNEPDIAEPFAHEAKYFVESRLLNRDVHVLLEGVDKYNNFYGTIQHPAGNISEEVLKVGLGKVVDWSAKFAKDAELLYKAERMAKEKRLRMWKDYTPPSRTAVATGSSAEFVGKVTEVISGDFLVIKDFAVPPVEHRVALSSIKAPRLGRRDEKDEPWAFEAREFLRSRLIGRKVNVGIDYMRALPNSATGETERIFVSVLEGGTNNVAIALVANGLASVMKHRQDDQDRSLYYDDLIQAEAAASRDKKGMHADKRPPPRNINDVSQASALAQAKQMFTLVQRAGVMKGVVQHVINGARYKVLIPSQTCIVTVALAGIRCPQTGRKDGEPGEPYGEEAYMFARDKCLQHDVEVEILAQDKVGAMISRMTVHGKCMASTLLENGYARMTGRDATSSMEDAQELARNKRLRTWEKYDQEVEAARAAESASELVESGAAGELGHVTITEMISPISFWVQVPGSEKHIDDITQRLAAMGSNMAAALGTKSSVSCKPGDVCVAKFSVDGAWYRAAVEARKGDMCTVRFIDFGNSEDVSSADMFPLPSTVPSPSQIPAQALEYKIAFIKAPSDSEMLQEAYMYMEELLAATNGQVGARVEFKERSGRCHATLIDQVSGEDVGAMLLRAGLAKLEKRRQDQAGLKQHQEAARSAHVGIWRYGDAADSDEEDNRMAQDVANAKSRLAAGKGR